MPHGRRHGKPAGTARRVHDRGGSAGGLWVALVLDRATNIDEVVGKHPKSDPAFDADIASISAAVDMRPCRRLATLMRPSQPVRHFWPLRNQRFFCSRLRSRLFVERFEMHTRLTALAFAAASFLPE